MISTWLTYSFVQLLALYRDIMKIKEQKGNMESGACRSHLVHLKNNLAGQIKQ